MSIITSRFPSRHRPTRRLPKVKAGGIGLAFALGAVLLTFEADPAAAQPSWEIGCAYRSLPTGNGDAQRALNCERQKTCQTMANAKGAMMMEMGCFLVEPTAREPSAAAVRQRPTQQQ